MKGYLLFVISILFGLSFSHLYWVNLSYDLKKGDLVNIEIDKKDVITIGRESLFSVYLPYKDTYMLSLIFPSPSSRDKGFRILVNEISIAKYPRERLHEKKDLRDLVDKYIMRPFKDIPSGCECLKLVIPTHLIHKGVNTIKFSYQQEEILPLSEIIIKNYRASCGPKTLFFSSNRYLLKKKDPFGISQVLYYLISPSFFLTIWIVYSSIFSFITKIDLSKALYLDLYTYIPPLLTLGGLASLPLISSFHLVTSLGDLILITSTLSGIGKIYLLHLYSPKDKVLEFLEYCRKDLAGTFILGFLLLLALCAILLIIDFRTVAEPIANLAYLLLIIGIFLRLVEYARKG